MRRFEEEHAQDRLQPTRLQVPVAANDQPSFVLWQWSQLKAPSGIGVVLRLYLRIVRIEGAGTKIDGGAESKKSLGFEGCYFPPFFAIWHAKEMVANLYMLPFFVDSVGTFSAPVVEPIPAIPSTAVDAHLHEIAPDIDRRCVDRDRHHRSSLYAGNDLRTWVRGLEFVCSRAPSEDPRAQKEGVGSDES